MAERYSQEEVTQFYRAADSLRKYRRAELLDEGTGVSVLDELYCDPLPHQGFSTRISSANTTLIIGRKGTGKSTVFQKLQHDIRQTNDRLTAYIDIKTIWDSCQVSLELQERIAQTQYALPPASIERMLLYRAFLKSIVEEIQRELDKKLAGSMWERIKDTFSNRLETLQNALAAFAEDYSDDNFIRVLGLKAVGVKAQAGSKIQNGSAGEIAVEVSPTEAKMSGKMAYSKSAEATQGEEAEFTDILVNVFDPGLLIKKLKALLTKAGIRHVFLLIDDFSELPLEAMRVVVNVLLAPMNNLSDEFLKLKIAAYPGRIFLGSIDRTKIDEVYLDLYKLYGSSDITKLEDSGIDFTRRILTQRLVHFCKGDPARFFERNFDEVVRQLFNASLCNPRILGHVLVYLHDTHIATGRLIGLRAVGEAARKFYEEKVETFFQTGRFLQEAFDERSSIFSLKELLETFVQRAKELRRHSSAVFLKIDGVPPTSHFYIPTQNESLLTTLELNFFLTKYFEMSDREGKKVAIFALNYGLCEKYSVTFGRPLGEREFRLYFVERVFDYSPLVLNYLKNNQEILCDSCGARYEHADLDKLQFYGMKCNKCASGICRVTNLSRKYETELNAVSKELLLPRTELGILQTLDIAAEPLRANEIAVELDCSYQLVGRRARNLEDRQLVTRDLDPDGRRSFALTDLARSSYFDPAISSDLSVDE